MKQNRTNTHAHEQIQIAEKSRRNTHFFEYLERDMVFGVVDDLDVAIRWLLQLNCSSRRDLPINTQHKIRSLKKNKKANKGKHQRAKRTLESELFRVDGDHLAASTHGRVGSTDERWNPRGRPKPEKETKTEPFFLLPQEQRKRKEEL